MGTLEAQLGGQGIDSVDLALVELDHADVLEPFVEVVSVEHLRAIGDDDRDDLDDHEKTVCGVLATFADLLEKAAEREGIDTLDPDPIVLALRRDLERVHRLWKTSEAATAPLEANIGRIEVFTWMVLRRLDEVYIRGAVGENAGAWLDEWLLARVLERQIVEVGASPDEARQSVQRVRLLLELNGWWVSEKASIDIRSLVRRLLARDPGRSFLGINRWDGELWYRAEAIDELADWLALVAEIDSWCDPQADAAIEDALDRLKNAHEASNYRVSDLLAVLERR